MSPLDLLDACEHVFYHPMISPNGRDSASVVQIAGLPCVVFGGTRAFGGTLADDARALRDWLNDLRAELVWRPEYRGCVHAGFAASLDALWPHLPAFKGSVLAAGHSKGKALAELFALRAALGGVRVRVVSFGGPMAGDRQFADAFDAHCEHDRYVNPHDIVPRLPPAGYCHTGYEIGPCAGWVSPRDVVEAHQLSTGYRPWVAEQAAAAA